MLPSLDLEGDAVERPDRARRRSRALNLQHRPSHSQVGVEHALGRRGPRGRALGDAPAEVEHDDAVAHGHHEVHVVLDEQHRHVTAQAADALAELAHVVAAEPAGRLVEQDEPGSRDERPRERDALLHREGQRAGQPVGDVGDAERVELPRARARAARARRGRSAAGRAEPTPGRRGAGARRRP